MPRHRRFLFLSLATVVVGLAGGVWLPWQQTAITRENAAKITEGMTLAEVEAILGGPPRDDTTGPVTTDVGYGDSSGWDLSVLTLNAFRDPQRGHLWKSAHVLVLVWVDAEGLVAYFMIWPLRRREESSLDMLRRWLRL